MNIVRASLLYRIVFRGFGTNYREALQLRFQTLEHLEQFWGSVPVIN
jgi:hypothetical protein